MLYSCFISIIIVIIIPDGELKIVFYCILGHIPQMEVHWHIMNKQHDYIEHLAFLMFYESIPDVVVKWVLIISSYYEVSSS